jgi:hypothetical protein
VRKDISYYESACVGESNFIADTIGELLTHIEQIEKELAETKANLESAEQILKIYKK